MDQVTGPGRHPTATAAALAAIVSLPGLCLPFMSDDWAHLAALERGDFFATPFGYCRPLLAASFWIDRHLWGLSGPLFHLQNILLIALAAALVVRLTERYGIDRPVATLAGILFALHPSHVESAAWVAARADPLCAVLVLLAANAWERWRAAPRGLAWVATALFALALLAKESAVALPAFLLLADLCRRDRRRDPGPTLRGLALMMAAATVHFLVLWPRSHGQTLVALFGERFLKRPGALVDSLTASILPAHGEIIEGHPALWALAAVGVAALIAGLSRIGAGRIPPVAWAALGALLILLAPSYPSFQDRCLFLPSAAAAVALAALLRAAGRRGRTVAAFLVMAWSVFLVQRWTGWLDAAHTGRRLIAELTAESLVPETRRIVVANMPHRIHGVPVFARFDAAVALQGGRSIPIDAIALIDYPAHDVDTLAGPADRAITSAAGVLDIALKVAPGPFSGLVWPGPGRPPGPESASGVVIPETPARLRIRLVPGDGRATYYWSHGRLRRLS